MILAGDVGGTKCNLALFEPQGDRLETVVVRRYPSSQFNQFEKIVAQFLVNESYAQQAYVFSEPFVAREKGAVVRCLLVAETGYNPYTSLLVTSGDTIRIGPGRFAGGVTIDRSVSLVGVAAPVTRIIRE